MTMTRLGRHGLAGFVALATLAGTSGNAWAGAACLKARDAHALQTAAMQQRLMVAALTCHEAPLYNRFVIAYRRELRRSDADLQRYFRHHGGMAGYHAYKTKLANTASLESLHGIRHYCADAETVFHRALDAGKVSLVRLVEHVSGPAASVCRHDDTRVAERDRG